MKISTLRFERFLKFTMRISELIRKCGGVGGREEKPYGKWRHETFMTTLSFPLSLAAESSFSMELERDRKAPESCNDFAQNMRNRVIVGVSIELHLGEVKKPRPSPGMNKGRLFDCEK